MSHHIFRENLFQQKSGSVPAAQIFLTASVCQGRETVGTLTDETFSHICCQITAELDSIKSCCTEERLCALGDENQIEFINYKST